MHFACIYQQSPEGLTNETVGEWGVDFPDIDSSLAVKLQEIAWDTSYDYNYSGINGTPTPDPVDDCSFDNDKPVIEGEGNLCIDGAVNITETLKLKPLGSPPSDPEKGTMYFDNIDNKLKVFDGTSWQNCW